MNADIQAFILTNFQAKAQFHMLIYLLAAIDSTDSFLFSSIRCSNLVPKELVTNPKHRKSRPIFAFPCLQIYAYFFLKMFVTNSGMSYLFSKCCLLLNIWKLWDNCYWPCLLRWLSLVRPSCWFSDGRQFIIQGFWWCWSWGQVILFPCWLFD